LVIVCFLIFGALNVFDSEVDFNHEIRPILNSKCMNCHGGVRQEAGLSFLHRDAALDTLRSGGFAIVPKSISKSKMIELIESEDEEVRMPPQGEKLSDQDIKLLKKWIRKGAKWEDHWAYVPIDEQISPPTVKSMWPHNNIDHFVLDKLSSLGYNPSSQAKKATLLRRVSLDLIGLPPPQHLIDQFLKNESAEGYEILVDSLLQSPHFGERWASMWLDLARYADSKGYQKDNLRKTIWMYRDWVIDAFNQDMPFDQFTIKQLAGDLLDSPTDQDYLATAFHRNTMSNDEGGTDDEEYRIAAILDRVNTTYEAWLSTTMSCVQCHSHPYDPIDHEEYYESFAIFNTTQDKDDGLDSPRMTLLSSAQKVKASSIRYNIEQWKSLNDTIHEDYIHAVQTLSKLESLSIPIMSEIQNDTVRRSHVFVRGNWLVKGDSVKATLPDKLNKYTQQAITNRLDFAKWIADSTNPLTSRVIVNRFWEQLFGNGLVQTVEDFGTQGERPSHPQLLDWLAQNFSTDMRWSVKSLLKYIVMSSTYRQTSNVSEELLEKDQYNKWLARGPRVRLSAEQIRDQALTVGGLMTSKLYGPSVMPYQPDGVWNTIRHVAKWETSTKGNQYRRGLYTFWRRVSPYPSMIAFDTPSRELCVSRRVRTNTPIQALITLNDPVYVEASQSLAKNCIDSTLNLESQINAAFYAALQRKPDLKTKERLLDLYYKTSAEYSSDGISDMEILHQKSMENVTSVIFNLDEFIMKS